MFKYRSFLCIVLIQVIVAAMLVSAAKVKKEKPSIDIDFSPDGSELTITRLNQDVFMQGVNINYCDGSHEKRGIWHEANSPVTYYLDKPIQTASVDWFKIPAKTSKALVYRQTIAERACEKPEVTPKLFCNQVKVPATFHRYDPQVPISFRSTQDVVKASLKIPGVDGLLTMGNWTRYYGVVPAMYFNYATHTWYGNFPSYIYKGAGTGNYAPDFNLIYLRPKVYRGVVLVIEDDFGQRVQCEVKPFTVLP